MDDIDRVNSAEASAVCNRCGKKFEAADRATAWAIAAGHQRNCQKGK
jgi:hypothetical protein